ncbi:hypothetical protein E2C01_065580 [Portunus trituberculatus]|uniref:Uncharacterized protein n=1 Tax=Portunus trituberculatus TaxID=210409 RepID=A0A5B7HMY1_PORTR|nr:hypothetical protein [Portunus trituberculatus]
MTSGAGRASFNQRYRREARRVKGWVTEADTPFHMYTRSLLTPHLRHIRDARGRSMASQLKVEM